jgi:hypothetical protein
VAGFQVTRAVRRGSALSWWLERSALAAVSLFWETPSTYTCLSQERKRQNNYIQLNAAHSTCNIARHCYEPYRADAERSRCHITYTALHASHLQAQLFQPVGAEHQHLPLRGGDRQALGLCLHDGAHVGVRHGGGVRRTAGEIAGPAAAQRAQIHAGRLDGRGAPQRQMNTCEGRRMTDRRVPSDGKTRNHVAPNIKQYRDQQVRNTKRTANSFGTCLPSKSKKLTLLLSQTVTILHCAAPSFAPALS